MSVGECHRRSIAKAVSWRATGTLDTFVLSWLITGNLAFAGSIAGVETMTKMVLYYGHERLWAAVAWGRGQAAAASGRTRRIPSLVRRTRTGIAALTGAGTRACHPLAGAAALGALIAVVAGSPLSSGGRRARVAALSEPAIPAPVARIAPSEVPAPSADPVAHAEAAALAPEPAETAGRARSGEPEATLPALPALLVEATSPDGAAATQPAGPDAAAAARPVRDLADPAQARAVQHRLADLGFFHAAATGLWGPRSRQALAAFKARSGLPRTDAWDEPTERSLFGAELRNVASFVGLWAPDAQACTPQLKQGGLLPATINEQGAWAGETSCQFQRRKQTGTVSTIVASCFDQRRRWTANVRIETHGDRLTWSSEQGSQTYVRCRAGQLYAQLAN